MHLSYRKCFRGQSFSESLRCVTVLFYAVRTKSLAVLSALRETHLKSAKFLKVPDPRSGIPAFHVVASRCFSFSTQRLRSVQSAHARFTPAINIFRRGVNSPQTTFSGA